MAKTRRGKRRSIVWYWFGVLVVVLGWYWVREQKEAAAEARRAEIREQLARAAMPGPISITKTRKRHLKEHPELATKTQVTDAAEIAGTMAVYNQETGRTSMLEIGFGYVFLVIRDISTSGWTGPDPQPSWGGEPNSLFAVYIAWPTSDMEDAQDHEFIEFKRDASLNPIDPPWDISRSFSVTVDGRELWRTESTSAGSGRTNSPVYAKEVTETDSWQSKTTVSYSATLGSLSWSSSGSGFGYSALSQIDMTFDQDNGQTGGTIYAAIADLTWDGATVNFSRYEYDNIIYLDGKSGGIELSMKSNSSENRAVSYSRPHIVDFTDFMVSDRDGTLIPTLKVDGPFQASNHYPASLSWSTSPS